MKKLLFILLLCLPSNTFAQNKGVLLENLTWQEAEKALKPETVVVIPLGAAAKEHGPHLKLKNDWTMAEYHKRRVLKAADVVIAPTVNYHFFPPFLEYPGSTSLRLETARDLIVDICRSLARFGPRRFYVINTGLSTLRALKPAAEALAAEGIRLHYLDERDLRQTVKPLTKQGGGSHADEIETSNMLYIDPASVDMRKAVKDYQPLPEGSTRIMFTRDRQAAARGEAIYSPTGSWGDPTLATREKGRKVTEATLALILEQIETLRQAAPPNTAASTSDWPQWRGPQRNGISQESGLLKQWPKEGPKLLWQVNDIGDGYSTPAVVGTRIYLMSNHGMENEFVQALSTEDGKPIWTTRVGNVGNPNQDPPYPKARSTPTVDGDFIYALGSDGDLACLEAKSGKIRWQKSLRKEFGGQPHEWAYAESPLVDGEVVVVTPGGAQATIVALNKKTGAVIWKSAVPGGDPAGYASAIVVQGGGRKQYVQFLSKGIVGVDAKTGAFLWRYKEVVKGPAQAFTPVARGAYVYGGALSIGGGLVRLKPDGAGVAAEQVYFERGLPNGFGGAVLVGDYLYGTEIAGQSLVAVEFITGKVKWKAENFRMASLAYADGHLYIHNENGDFVLVEATPEGYREKGRFTPPNQPKKKQAGQLAEGAYAYPVIANGRLYIRDLETLWAYDIKASR